MPTDFAVARRNMVDGQLRPNQIVHAGVLEALAALPRERFLPDDRAAVAYADEAVPLGSGRYLMEPMVLARLVQLAQPAERDVALVVGAGPGYGAAVLARLVDRVVALESDESLAARARTTLSGLGIGNVSVVVGKLADGYPAGGLYDLIVVEGAVPAIPAGLTRQLGASGRLVGIVSDGLPGHPGRAHLGRNVGGMFSSRPVFDAGTPVLPGFERPGRFVF
jgi:protein-L-isoaspartate(D-aspartate) O-methyltransferase